MKIDVETPLDDILPTENIRQSENVVVARVKLIESPHDRRIPARVIVLGRNVRPPGKEVKRIASLDITGTRTDGIIGEGAAFQDTLETVVEVGGQLACDPYAGSHERLATENPLTACDRWSLHKDVGLQPNMRN